MRRPLSAQAGLDRVERDTIAFALSLRPVRLSGTQAVAKRAFDLVMGAFLLLATLPLWLAAAAAIRLTSPGPVFFHQERVTRGGLVQLVQILAGFGSLDLCCGS